MGNAKLLVVLGGRIYTDGTLLELEADDSLYVVKR